MIDTHCHLTYKGLDEIKEKVIEQAKQSMDAIVTCGFPKDCKKALELSKKHNGFIFLTLGLHPSDIIEMSDKEIQDYLRFVKNNKENIVAIGEIGLDRHWYPEQEKQPRLRKVFIDMLDLANELELPVILHTRKAEQECFDIVKERMKEVVFHCYSGNLTLAEQIVNQGYYISVGTNLMKSKNTKKIAKKFSLDRLFTETDSPFLSPFPGKVNVPQNVRFVLENMSSLRNESIESIDQVIMKNSKKLFNI